MSSKNLPPEVSIIRHEIPLLIVSSLGGYIPTEWRYDPYDPYAVRLALKIDSGEPIGWMFARDLALWGLTERTGTGDVQFRPDSLGQDVRLRLSSPDGEGMYGVSRPALASFLGATVSRVPRGEESSWQDPAIERLHRKTTRVVEWRQERGKVWPRDWFTMDAVRDSLE